MTLFQTVIDLGINALQTFYLTQWGSCFPSGTLPLKIRGSVYDTFI